MSQVPAHGIQLVGSRHWSMAATDCGRSSIGSTLLDRAKQENVLKDAQLWISGATSRGGRSRESCYWLDRMYFF